jgi:hypothetical protein
MAIAYEDVLGEAIHTYSVRAFPTYVFFVHGSETARVEGANLPAVEAMMAKGLAESGGGMVAAGGQSLGGAGSAAPLTPVQARAARLAKLGGGSAPAPVAPTPMETDDAPKSAEAAAAPEPMDEDKEETPADPTANLDATAIGTLTTSMGFSLLRAQKGLLYGNGGTVESAVEWLLVHQEDDDIDEAIPATADGLVAQSYKCNDCGKILSNMANLELHANKTGHADFEESTQAIAPLTPEEKRAKMLEIKDLLKAKRAEREDAEKVEDVSREIQRRTMGQQVLKTREQMDREARKREATLRKREKDSFKRERMRLREEIAKDKAERQANKGKLNSRLGVDGYQPDGIQYDVDVGGGAEATDAASPAKQPKTFKSDSEKIDSYIARVASYKAGGDGAKGLKVLKAYVGNVVDQPAEIKFRTINMENKAYKIKVKPLLGSKQLLLAVGFVPNTAGDAMVLGDDADRQVLAETKAKLEAALAASG